MTQLRTVLRFAFLTSVVLSGCGTPAFDLPPAEDGGGPTVATIVQRVKCELMMVIKGDTTRELLKDDHYQVGVQLSLTINESGELAPSFLYTPTSMFNFGAGFKLGRAREQNFTQNFYFTVDRLDRDSQLASSRLGKRSRFDECPHPSKTNLDGDLGIAQTVRLAFTGPYSNRNAILNSAQGEFGGYVQFVVTRNINAVGPTWTLQHFIGPGRFGGLSRVNTDKITFGFAPSAGVEYPETEISPRLKDLLEQLNISQIQLRTIQ